MARRLNWSKSNAAARVRRDDAEETRGVLYSRAAGAASSERAPADLIDIRGIHRLAELAKAMRLQAGERVFIQQLARVASSRRLYLSPKQKAWLDKLRKKYPPNPTPVYG